MRVIKENTMVWPGFGSSLGPGTVVFSIPPTLPVNFFGGLFVANGWSVASVWKWAITD